MYTHVPFTEVVSFSLLRIIKQHNNGVLHCNINQSVTVSAPGGV